MMKRLFFLIGIFLGTDAEAYAEVYTNARFGFQVELPPEKMACGPEYAKSDHGFFIPLKKIDCVDTDNVAGLYVGAYYNVLGLRSGIEESRSICHGMAIGPNPFRVAGYRFHQC